MKFNEVLRDQACNRTDVLDPQSTTLDHVTAADGGKLQPRCSQPTITVSVPGFRNDPGCKLLSLSRSIGAGWPGLQMGSKPRSCSRPEAAPRQGEAGDRAGLVPNSAPCKQSKGSRREHGKGSSLVFPAQRNPDPNPAALPAAVGPGLHHTTVMCCSTSLWGGESPMTPFTPEATPANGTARKCLHPQTLSAHSHLFTRPLPP